MYNDIFKPVRDLLDSRDNVTSGNAVHNSGCLYGEVVERLNALRMLEPSLIELIETCLSNGMASKALDEIIELMGIRDNG
jgi:hypothetical protein